MTRTPSRCVGMMGPYGKGMKGKGGCGGWGYGWGSGWPHGKTWESFPRGVPELLSNYSMYRQTHMHTHTRKKLLYTNTITLYIQYV